MAAIMIRASRLGFLVLAGWLFALGSPAGATTLYAKFYTGTTGYTGAYSGSGTVYDATKTRSTDCPTSNPGCGAFDILNSPLDFTANSVGIHATANTNVWDDLTPNFGGLGVGLSSQGTDADQISAVAGDSLTLKFSIPVMLRGIATLFDNQHEDFGTGFPTAGDVTANAATVQFYLTMPNLNGGSPFLVSFADANNGALDYFGTTFTFTAVNGDPDYYVSALAFDPTPVPAALPLFATGLGVLGLLGWYKKRTNAKRVLA